MGNKYQNSSQTWDIAQQYSVFLARKRPLSSNAQDNFLSHRKYLDILSPLYVPLVTVIGITHPTRQIYTQIPSGFFFNHFNICGAFPLLMNLQVKLKLYKVYIAFINIYPRTN